MILGVLCAGRRSNRALLEPLLGQPMLGRQLERLGRSRRMDALVAVMGVDGGDDAVAALCTDLQVPCCRSEKINALDQVYEASLEFAPGHVVCLDASRPLTDPALIDEVIEEHLDGDHDCTSSALPPSYPRGTEVEVVRFSCLQEAWQEAPPPHRHEAHRFVREHPDRYGIGSVSAESDYSRNRWIVKQPADLELINRIYESLYRETPDFSWRDVLALLERSPAWAMPAPGGHEEDEMSV